MLAWIFDLLICSAILLALVEWLGDDAIDFTSAAVVAFIATAGATVAGYFLRSSLGDWSIVAALLIAAVLVGALLLLKYGVELKRAFLIGGLFVVGCIAWKFGLALFLAAIF